MTTMKQLAQLLGISKATIYNTVSAANMSIDDLTTGRNGKTRLFDNDSANTIIELYKSKKEQEQNRVFGLIGTKRGRLYIKEYLGPSDNGNKYLCLCDCGNITTAVYSELVSGNKVSCGCLRQEIMAKQRTTHGDTHKKLYHIWRGMRTRCNPKYAYRYPRYSGRNITLCDEWMDYSAFKEWSLSHGYSDNLSIERIDNNKGYSPDNCCWIPLNEQSKNQERSFRITIGNQTKILADWCKEYNIHTSTVWARIRKYGWNVEKAITTPVRAIRHKSRGEKNE